MKLIFPIALITVCFSMFISSCSDMNSDPGLSFEAQVAKDTTTIGSYLRAKNISALKDASGVRFVIDSLVAGFPPRGSNIVKFKYVGSFLSGTVFDKGEISGAVNSFVSGFQIALSLLPEGSKGRFFIPSGFGYGEAGTTGIPPNSILIFEITLLDVVTTETEKQRLATDTVAIDDYLNTNSINPIKDKTGIRYVITQLGTGLTPNLYSKVKMNYTSKLLSSGTVFFTGSSEPTATFDSRVINYIYAFQAVLPKLPAGSKATVYIPSGLGFGAQSFTSGSVSIAANSNLVYEIELVSFVN